MLELFTTLHFYIFTLYSDWTEQTD